MMSHLTHSRLSLTLGNKKNALCVDKLVTLLQIALENQVAQMQQLMFQSTRKNIRFKFLYYLQEILLQLNNMSFFYTLGAISYLSYVIFFTVPEHLGVARVSTI